MISIDTLDIDSIRCHLSIINVHFTWEISIVLNRFQEYAVYIARTTEWEKDKNLFLTI